MVTAGVNALTSHTLPALLWIIGGALAVIGSVHYPSPLLSCGIAVLIIAAVATTHVMIAAQDRRHAEQREIDRTVRQTENEYAAELAERLIKSATATMNGSPHEVDPNVIRLIR